MTLAQLPADVQVESNPFSPTVPESLRDLSPDLYEYLRDLAGDMRQQHVKTQAGSPSNNWSQMLTIDLTPRYTLGSVGNFYSSQFGVFTGIYVAFDKMQALPIGGPVTRVDTEWTVSNDWNKSVTRRVLGILPQGTIPPNGSFGWILVQGINVGELTIAGAKPTRGDCIAWESDNSLQIDGTSSQLVGQLVDDTDLTQIGGTWVIGAGCVLVDSAGGLSDFALRRVAATTVTTAIPQEITKQIDDLNQTINFIEGQNALSVAILSTRISKINGDGAQISLTQKLSAAANYANLANTAADNALRLANATGVNLNATTQLTQTSQVYSNQAGYYAQSAIQQAATATLQANNSLVSANSSSTFAQDAQTSATAAGVSATASETSRQASAVQAGNAATSATNAQTYATSASGSAASATTQASLAATYAAQTADGNAAGFTAVNANIAAETTARVAADSAEASARSTLAGTVGGHTSSITSLQSVLQTGATGYAQATLTLDVNGHVSGYKTTNSGATSQFIITTDTFVITDGTTNKNPFSISGGVVSMTNVVIDTLKVNTAVIPVYVYDNNNIGGNFSNTLISSGTIHMPQAGVVEVEGGVIQGFSAVPRSWNLYLYINGIQVWHPRGTYPGDLVYVGGFLACPAGDINIQLYMNSDSAVSVGERFMKIFGYPNTSQ